MTVDRAERILEQLRARGARVTTPRRAVIVALAADAGHLSAADLSERVQAANPDVHQSTVYRTLDRLVEMHLVEHIHVAHGPAVYHLADDHHVHAVCSACGTVIDAPVSVLRAAAEQLRKQHGFTLAAGHVALTGRCRDCAS